MFGRISNAPVQRSGSWIKWDSVDCVVNRYTYCHLKMNLPGNKTVWTHNGCICNQYMALRYRHQVETHPPDFNESQVEEVFSRLLRYNPIELLPWKRHAVVNSYAGSYKRKYLEAHKTYHRIGLQKFMSRVNLFCKDDSYTDAPEKAPRAIQYRHPTFMLEMGRFTKAVEEWFYHTRDSYGTLIVGKTDPYTIGTELVKKSAFFNDPVYLMLDASKFDTCVDVKWLKLVVRCYKTLFPRRFHRTIDWLWGQTYINRGRTRTGLRFKTRGTRMSGDMDTGLGNSIIMYLMLSRFLDNAGVKGSIMVNGDDSLVVVARSNLHKLMDIGIFKTFGFSMKFDVAYEIQKAEFCQSRLVYTDYGPAMSLNPLRAVNKMAWTTTKYGKRHARQYVKTLALCGRAANWGMPILYPLAEYMARLTRTEKEIGLRPYDLEWKELVMKWWRMKGEATISMETRVSFEYAWGIPVSEQLEMERRLKASVIYEPTQAHLMNYHYMMQG